RHQQLDLPLGAQRQRLADEAGIFNRLGKKNERWSGALVIELADKCFEHFARRHLARMTREIRLVAPVLAGPEEKHLDAGLAALIERGEDIGIGEGRRIDALVELDMAHGANAIAQSRGGFIVERRGGLVHLLDQTVLYRAALARQEQLGLMDQLGIALLVDAADTGRTATLDLEQKTRPRARLE